MTSSEALTENHIEWRPLLPPEELLKNRLGDMGWRGLDGDNMEDLPTGGKYDTCWTNIWSIRQNWNSLPLESCYTIHRILGMPLMGETRRGFWGVVERNAYGAKRVDRFAPHLVALAMMERYNEIVESNIDNERKFPKHSSILSPRTANWRGRLWTSWREGGLNRLFNGGWKAKTLVVHLGDYELGDPSEEFWGRWEEVERCLKLARRRGEIAAFMWSHEISPSSILRGAGNQHTHVIVWYRGDWETAESKIFKNFSISVDPRGFNSLTSGFRRFITYLHGVNIGVEAYRDEWTPSVSREINEKWPNLVEAIERIFKAGRRIGGGGLPREKRLLLKEEEGDKIMETRTIQNGKSTNAKSTKGSRLRVYGELDRGSRGGEPELSKRSKGGSTGRGCAGGGRRGHVQAGRDALPGEASNRDSSCGGKAYTLERPNSSRNSSRSGSRLGSKDNSSNSRSSANSSESPGPCGPSSAELRWERSIRGNRGASRLRGRTSRSPAPDQLRSSS
jgi:hypothetical protein